MPTIAPFGSWSSPITASLVSSGQIPLHNVRLDGPDDMYWSEGRPGEGGRNVLVRRAPDGTISQLTPPGFNVRTRVHEYGGGAYTVRQTIVWFANFSDQRVYRQDGGGTPRAITPEPAIPAGVRFADFEVTQDRQSLLCVRETHSEDREAVNDLALLDAGGATPPRSVVAGADFYAYPRLSPDGRELVWISWNHPNMPWDGCELWRARFDGREVGPPRLVAGGKDESIFQPAWSPDGVLHFVSDRTGWWNLYRCVGDRVEAVLNAEAEFGYPLWQFGMATYAFLPAGRIACIVSHEGQEQLDVIDPGASTLSPLTDRFTAFQGPNLAAAGGTLALIGASHDQPFTVVTIDPASGTVTELRRSLDEALPAGSISRPRPITFRTSDGELAHGLHYAPNNSEFAAPYGDLPPLIVFSHGGPTGNATAALNLQLQFWTSRGFAVVDVDYRGSSGFGRAYRQALNGEWGVIDTADCISATRYLAGEGLADPNRLAIRGGSAGGYTTLCALTFHDVFKAGASYYGVADLETLATDTHKFESRYLDGLIGAYPAEKELYIERSPIHFVDRLSCPLIIFQGLEDKVVPPSQAEDMAQALDRKGLPYAYLAFEGEQHGFRKAETNKRALEAELAFYGRVFGFKPADDLPPLDIHNAEALGTAD